MLDTITGVERIAAERQRQITEYGWDDTLQPNSELVWAAITYAAPEPVWRASDEEVYYEVYPSAWAYRASLDSDTLTRLAIAGALIAAEIDRLTVE